jgi:hypothetical protein
MLACKKGPATSASNNYTECQLFIFDLSDGTMNGVKPNLSQNEIREWIPCFTRITPNGADADCRGALVYEPHYFTFYTYTDDYIEVKKGFKGKGDTLFLLNRSQLRNLLGTPVQNSITTENQDKDFFTTDYGCIRVQYRNDLPVLIAPHYSDCEGLKWCEEEKQ